MKKKTKSLCPICLQAIPATKECKGKDVFLTKECPEHGRFTVQIAKDSKRFFDTTYDVQGKSFNPSCKFNGECGRDCGWCEEHRQHICTGLIEITDACSMRCPICYFGDKEANHISVEEFQNRLNTLIEIENGHLDVLQISGGECLLHPQFHEILDIAVKSDIGRVLINTNGRALRTDEAIFDHIYRLRDCVEIYLQFDGFDDSDYLVLRGMNLADEKHKIISKLDRAGIKICLAVTVYAGNLKQIPDILKLSTTVRNISGITFQRLTKVGNARGTPVKSVFQEDILLEIANSGYMKYSDIIPLPCSHPNCTSLGFLFCQGDNVYSLGDYIDFSKCTDTISNRIAFDKTILDYMQKNVCKCFVGRMLGGSFMLDKLQDFASGNGSCHKDMKIVRVLVKNFMDADTFDFERATKCCTGVSVGNNKVIPFCVHNALKGKCNW